MSNSLPVTECSGEFHERVRAARDLALKRLGDLQSGAGSWCMPIYPNGLTAAAFVILLRTSGLIERVGQFELEKKLVRVAARYTNPDGGFWKYPGSPSSLCLTRVFLTALRLVLGEIEPGSRSAEWFRRNPLIDATLESELKRVAERACRFLACGRPEASWQFDLDLRILTPLLVSHADNAKRLPPIVSWLPRPRRPSRHFHFLWHAAWPALNILSTAPGNKSFPDFVGRIRSGQDSSGAWEISSLITMINIMALVKAGIALDDPAVRRGHESIVRDFLIPGDAGFALAAWRSHVADTAYGLETSLRAGNSGMWEPAIRFLLVTQSPEGGFAWGTSLADPDADTTAHVVRSFPMAARPAPQGLSMQIQDALRRGAAFMLARQNHDGGFSCWRPSRIPGHRGPLPVWLQLLFDTSTADVTARIVEALAFAGYDTRQPAIRRALHYLLKTQSSNGGWWSRWWPGYLAGAGFALRTFGALGLRLYANLPAEDLLLRRSGSAMARAVEFIVTHQNADGGWGETIRSDLDIRCAGRGNSSPAYTAHVAGALLRVGHPKGSALIRRGIEYLLRTMSPDGRWTVNPPYLTIFARCHYVTYQYLMSVLPLDALTDFLQASQ